MERDLRAALLDKEKAELFLSNLERLRSDKAVNEMSYNALKTEYAGNLQHALIQVEHIKQELNKTLSSKNRELGIYKQELANLDARFRVGQISADTFLRLARNPEKKIAALEEQTAHLISLISAKHSAEISVAETSGLGLFFMPKARPEMKHSGTGMLYQELTASPPVSDPPPPEPAKVQDPTSISSLSILPDRALPGSTIGVIATIVNSGPGPVNHRAEFKVNDRIESVQDINLNPGQSEELTFMTVAGTPGDYYVSVDNATGILKVLPSS